MIGRVIGGSAGKVLLRVKSTERVDIGDILIVEENKTKFYIKVINILINSLLPGQFIDEIAGQKLEHEVELKLFDEEDRFYKVCEAKILKVLINDKFVPPRNIPHYFADARLARADEFKFLSDYEGVEIGCLRLGTRELRDVNVKIPAQKLINHHVLISAATGKGKSNFAKVFIRGLLDLNQVSALVMDPHNEYYGNSNNKGLRDLRSERVVYFTPKTSHYPGSERLIIYAEDVKSGDLMEVIPTSTAQNEALRLISRTYGNKWLIEFLENQNNDEVYKDLKSRVHLSTISALKRKLGSIFRKNGLVFTLKKREESSIFDKIKRAVKEGKIIIIDTSLVGDLSERLITTSIVRGLFNTYKQTKEKAPELFNQLPELMVLFEEAPRVLGKAVLSRGTNTFARIAREGRKFKVGLCAITQMPSILSQEILSQMNTKVILGIPSPADRRAIIDSSAQDINDESTEIQMLDKGEAIITSPFTSFPLPVKIHFFDNLTSNRDSASINIGLS